MLKNVRKILSFHFSRPKDYRREKSEQISSAYRVKIFEDEKENHIVTSLPTMISKPGKAKYEVKQVESDSDIDAKQRKKLLSF